MTATQPAAGTVIGHLRGRFTDSRPGPTYLRCYRVELVADPKGDALNAETGLRYRLRRTWI